MILKILLLCGLAYLAYRLLLPTMRPATAMPRAEAARLLGLDASADTEAVLDAHRRLIAKVHPDTGGSAELAARINQARDIMLKP